MEHNLIILSLHDAQLECSACSWRLVRPGEMSIEEAEEEFKRYHQ